MNQYDALVIGAGPAGTSAATVLATKGWKVLVLEKEKFPRYHVGESLLPFCYYTFERLGLLDKMKESHFVKKYSVQFVSTRGNISQPFYFFQHMDHPSSTTWQVSREEFDMMMLEHAKSRGAEVLEETSVTDFIEENDSIVGVKAKNVNGEELEFRAPMTIDASGLKTVAVKKHQWRVPDSSLNKMAVWTYYVGAKRDEGYDEGATTVAYLPEKGWFWYIPLHDNKVSVGIVAEPSYLYRDGRDPKIMFEREINNNPWIKDHLEPGCPTGKYFTTADYSFRSKHCARNGLVLTGDAFSFLDPVFSSGVFLALRGGELAGETVANALQQKIYTADQFDDYGKQLCHGIEAMRKLVYAFYDEEFSFRDLIKKHPDLHGDLTDCLIGNLYKDFDPLFEAVEEFASVPKPLEHGLPLVA
jgi:flavin-dependent dehydrogenase